MNYDVPPFTDGTDTALKWPTFTDFVKPPSPRKDEITHLCVGKLLCPKWTVLQFKASYYNNT